MPQTYHIRATKDYAVSLLELLKKEGAIEDLELKQFDLSESQQAAIDAELNTIASDTNHLQNWEDVKQRFKKP